MAGLLLVFTLYDNIKAQKKMKPLNSVEKSVIIDKNTEAPYTGKYYKFDEDGTYLCRQCGAPLYRSEDKFDSGCGWPSFDNEIEGAVKRVVDRDGRRTEILCAKCGAHLGHVFEGEGLTLKNMRHCVNSVSLEFEGIAAKPQELDTAIFAGGCFWGIEHLMQKVKGVETVESGYTGGTVPNPTYEQVCSGKTAHVEAVRITYNPTFVSYKELVKLFFEIHDPTQATGQGPDIGQQYLSVVFYANSLQKTTAEELIKILENKGYNIATQLKPASVFYPAEDYHQDYYKKNGKEPYCHIYTKRF